MKPCFSSIEPLEARIAPAFAATFELSGLNGLNGFKLSGVAAEDFAGHSVSDAGDVNGDGFGDVIIGASASDSPATNSGASYVIFGKAAGFAANLNLSALDGSNGFKISGFAASDRAGSSASAAGDVNGDGFDDVIIGAPGRYSAGSSYVIFGKASAFPAMLNVSTLNGANGFKVNGVAAEDVTGLSVSAAGDVNGDSFDDVIIGAPQHGPGDRTGVSYVVFGKASGFAATLNASALNGVNGFKISGVAARDAAGVSVSDAGDVNGDGFDDLIIGANGADPNGNGSGASYVLFGKASGFAANVQLSALDGSNGFKLSGVAAFEESGGSVSAAGDVNGDGFDDVVIGAAHSPSGVDTGASYVVFGKASGFAANLNLATLNGSNGFKLNGAAFQDVAGWSLSSAGDVNGDGFDDLIIGAIGADPNGADSGASYVIYGKAAGFAANLNLATLDGRNGFKLSGVAAGDHTGDSVSAAGDLNGDGFGDLIIGASVADPNGNSSGASYVVFGRGIKVNVSDATTTEGDNGTTALQFTVSLSEAGTFPVNVDVATADGTAFAGSDFVGLNKTTLTFAPGELTKTVTINATGDTLYENDERFSVVLSNPVGVGIKSDGTGVGRIVNDDAPPVVSIADGTMLEGDAGTSSLVFTVSLSEASGLPATVNFATANGTALAGIDFTAVAPGTLTFAPGETTKTITVDLLGDQELEDHEQFSVVLSDVAGATLGSATAIGTILNDDSAIHISDAGNILEGDTGTAPAVFTVTLERASALPVSVNFTTANGTANAGSDIAAVVGTLNFAPGETSKTITIEVTGDTNVEAHETFSLVLSEPENATLANHIGTATILNDDARIMIGDASILEGHTGSRTMTFTVSLPAPSALPVSVDFASADGTATAGAGYTALTPGTLHFAPGETSKTLTVEVLSDVTVESSETFSVSLADALNAIIDDSSALGTILDDDVKLVSKRVASFTDTDGDLVTIKVSKGTLKVEDFILFPSGLGSQLALVDFSGQAEFAGADLSIVAKRAPGTPSGSRFVDVGAIDASDIDLGKVLIKGDLGQIDAGNDLDPKPGLRGLSAQSLGQRGLDTQLPGGSLKSEIAGVFTKFKLSAGVHDAALSVSGDIGGIEVKGSVLASTIESDGTIGSIKIGGDLAADDTQATLISARGLLAPTSAKQAIAIRSISIGGSVDHASILAGYDHTGAASNPDVSIGEVVVGRDWIASNLVAGVSAGSDELFGTDDDKVLPQSNSIIARIASIVIKGSGAGSGDAFADHYGFVAEQITFFAAGGIRLQLNSGPSNDLAAMNIGSTGNLSVREIA